MKQISARGGKTKAQIGRLEKNDQQQMIRFLFLEIPICFMRSYINSEK